MKATLETVTGVTINRDIDTADSPMGINDCINNFRIEKALQMLRETNCNMLEISEAVGFSSQRYFSTFFKKMVGCTPTKYREENLQ